MSTRYDTIGTRAAQHDRWPRGDARWSHLRALDAYDAGTRRVVTTP